MLDERAIAADRCWAFLVALRNIRFYLVLDASLF